MIYLDAFRFPTLEQEDDFLAGYYSFNPYGPQSHYPFGILSLKGLHSLDFTDITIIYGGNGSGKSTALNIISSKLGLSRSSAYNKGDFQKEYLRMCRYTKGELIEMEELKDKAIMISSDDIFKYMLDNRKNNDSIRRKTASAVSDYHSLRESKSVPRFLDTVTKRYRKMSCNQYLKETIGERTMLFSNGETGFKKFVDSIIPDRLYILDEPENSLSCELQIQFANYIAESARYFGCQFIIATHSPFLLAMENAKIYYLDANPATISQFNELPNMKLYYELFKKYDGMF